MKTVNYNGLVGVLLEQSRNFLRELKNWRINSIIDKD